MANNTNPFKCKYGEHGDDSATDEDDVKQVAMLLSIQSLLNQFSNVKVRADLINGKFQ